MSQPNIERLKRNIDLDYRSNHNWRQRSAKNETPTPKNVGFVILMHKSVKDEESKRDDNLRKQGECERARGKSKNQPRENNIHTSNDSSQNLLPTIEGKQFYTPDSRQNVASSETEISEAPLSERDSIGSHFHDENMNTQNEDEILSSQSNEHGKEQLSEQIVPFAVIGHLCKEGNALLNHSRDSLLQNTEHDASPKKVKCLQEENNMLKKESLKLQCENHRLDKELDTLNKDLTISKNKISTCTSCLYDCLTELLLDSDIEKLWENDSVENLAGRACNHLNKYKRRFEASESEREQVEKQLASIYNEVKESERRLREEKGVIEREIKSQKNEHVKLRETLQKKIEELVNDKEAMSRKIRGMEQNREAEFASRVTELKKEFEFEKQAFEERVSVMTKSFENASERYLELQTQYEEARKTERVNKQTLEKLQTANETTQNDNIQLKGQLLTFQSQNKDLLQNYKDLEQTTRNEITEHMSKVKTLKDHNRNITEQNKVLEQQLTEQRLQVARQTEKVQSEWNMRKHTEVAALQEEVDILKQKLTNEAANWKRELQTRETTAKKHAEKLIEQQTNDMQREKGEYIAEKEEIIQRLTKEISQLKHEEKQLKHQMSVEEQKYRERLDAFKSKEKQDILDQKNQEIDLIKSKQEHELDKYKSKLQVLANTVTSLEDERSEAIRDISRCQVEIERLSSVIKKQETVISELEGTNKMLIGDHKNSLNKCQELERQMNAIANEHNQEIARLTEQHDKLFKKLRRTISDLKSQKDKSAEPGIQFDYVSISTEEIQRQLAKRNSELVNAKEEINDLKTRLSQLMAQKLTDNNPNIADLSDKNRPTKLAERYTELYDNQWTDAYETIEKSTRNRRNEQKTIELLTQILQETMKFCRQESEDQMQRLRSAVLMSDKTNEFSSSLNKQLKDCRKATVETSSKRALAMYMEHLQKSSTKIAKQSLLVPEYVKECFFLSWLMCVQDPPVVIGDTALTKGHPFNTDVYKAYTVSGQLVDYLVWPALYLHKGGPLLSKGVAQASNTRKR